jgi:hypothetical protein
MVDPLVMHAFWFLTTLSLAPKVFTLCVVSGGGGVWELICLRPHNLHGTTVPHDFLSPYPPHWGPAKGAALFQVWCTQELGPNGCRNLDRDAERDVMKLNLGPLVGFGGLMTDN